MQFNTRIQTFPPSVIANMTGFEEREFFEIEAPEERVAPKVSFE
jgi:LemA protein